MILTNRWFLLLLLVIELKHDSLLFQVEDDSHSVLALCCVFALPALVPYVLRFHISYSLYSFISLNFKLTRSQALNPRACLLRYDYTINHCSTSPGTSIDPKIVDFIQWLKERATSKSQTQGGTGFPFFLVAT